MKTQRLTIKRFVKLYWLQGCIDQRQTLKMQDMVITNNKKNI
uniref:Uncharacterized protein n=1 Tax=viral metagenome TaxID=1070528 RepID=A0A6C0C5N1_9ZZZZ